MNKSNYIAHEIFKLYGCSCSSECPKVKSDDNLYLIGLNYRGLYEDDYCTFWYLNAETGEQTSDSWTTAGACPCFDSYLRMMVPDAHNAGYISDEVYNKFVNDRWNSYLKSVAHDLTTINQYIPDFPVVNMIGRELNIPVVINGGRKYRGKATLLELIKEQDGPWVYRNRGYHVAARILGEDNNIYIVRPSYIDASDIMETIAGKLNAIIEANPEDSEELTNIYPFVSVDTSSAVDVKAQQKLDKYNAFKESKMPGLIEWCRSKAPEKSEDEITEWAEKIFARKYPMK